MNNTDNNTLFVRNSKIQPVLKTVKAILYHQGTTGNHHRYAVTTVHDVQTDEAGQPLIGPGSPVTETDKAWIQKSLLPAKRRRKPYRTGFLPPQVLSVSEKGMAWYIPAHTAPMFYLLREAHSENDSLNAVPWPTLVYVASKNSLHIAAVKVKSRPKPRSRLHHAPLMNVYDSTSVCTGSIELPSDTTVDSLPQWQKVIEQTFFTHTNHSRTLASREKVITDALYGFWQSLEGIEQFPTRRLAPILGDDKQPLYLEDWINEHL